jgi:hypothetical protein
MEIKGIISTVDVAGFVVLKEAKLIFEHDS